MQDNARVDARHTHRANIFSRIWVSSPRNRVSIDVLSWHRRRPNRNAAKNSKNVSPCTVRRRRRRSQPNAFELVISQQIYFNVFLVLHQQLMLHASSVGIVERSPLSKLTAMIDFVFGSFVIQCHWLPVNIFPIYFFPSETGIKIWRNTLHHWKRTWNRRVRICMERESKWLITKQKTRIYTTKWLSSIK